MAAKPSVKTVLMTHLVFLGVRIESGPSGRMSNRNKSKWVPFVPLAAHRGSCWLCPAQLGPDCARSASRSGDWTLPERFSRRPLGDGARARRAR
jgi:hypothetical protein